MKKTIPVSALRKEVNRLLQLPTLTVNRFRCITEIGIPPESKAILCSLLESFLMNTGNYKGFRWHNLPDCGSSADPEYYTRHYY